nr:MAG TPA: hypothetical protein [Bacteriophage sp.]
MSFINRSISSYFITKSWIKTSYFLVNRNIPIRFIVRSF